MSLIFKNPAVQVSQIISFLRTKYDELNKDAVIAISGGIDSALGLTLLTKALGAERIMPVFLPFGQQSVIDSWKIVEFNGFAKEQVKIINIEPLVTAAQKSCQTDNKARLGNLMARARMMILYDLAKAKDALVCGTENKSEKYLGYFTRFGDEASDIEPIIHLYKTQVRQLAEYLNLPQEILEKEPSAGLWADQTDELELGFTYEQADLVLVAMEELRLIDHKNSKSQIPNSKQISNFEFQISKEISEKIIKQIAERVVAMEFKHVVPYTLS